VREERRFRLHPLLLLLLWCTLMLQLLLMRWARLMPLLLHVQLRTASLVHAGQLGVQRGRREERHGARRQSGRVEQRRFGWMSRTVRVHVHALQRAVCKGLLHVFHVRPGRSGRRGV